jgi:hypothetical protein
MTGLTPLDGRLRRTAPSVLRRVASPAEVRHVSGNPWTHRRRFYALVGRPRPGPGGKNLCDPPAGVRDHSWHVLTSPRGRPVSFVWSAADALWLSPSRGSSRVGYDPAYLSSYGWQYDGSARTQHG